MNSKHILISKLDAAKRQLETAIILFFSDNDDVSIHTLASASSDILRDLGSVLDEKTIFDKIKTLIKPDKLGEFKKIINKPKQFFKHANQDPLEQLKFYPVANEFTLFFAVEAYSEIKGEVTPVMMSYRAFFYLKNPNLLLEQRDKSLWGESSKEINIHDKKQFIEIIEFFEKKKLEIIMPSSKNKL